MNPWLGSTSEAFNILAVFVDCHQRGGAGERQSVWVPWIKPYHKKREGNGRGQRADRDNGTRNRKHSEDHSRDHSDQRRCAEKRASTCRNALSALELQEYGVVMTEYGKKCAENDPSRVRPIDVQQIPSNKRWDKSLESGGELCRCGNAGARGGA